MLAIFFISGTASIKVSILNCPALYAEFTELCPLPAIVPPVAKIVIFGKSAAFAIETPRPNKVHPLFDGFIKASIKNKNK